MLLCLLHVLLYSEQQSGLTLKLVARGFLRTLRFPPLLHQLMVQPIKYISNEYDFNSVKLNS